MQTRRVDATPLGGIAAPVGALPRAFAVSCSVNVAAPWDKAVVLRLGRFRALRGPPQCESDAAVASITSTHDPSGHDV